MSFQISKVALIKLASIAVFIAIAVAAVMFGERQEVDASAFGPSASHTDAPGEDNCTSCHSSFPVNTGNGSVAITGLPHDYLPNQQIPITVRTAQPDAVIYGFQMTAINSQGQTVGTFTLPNTTPMRMQTVNGLVNGQIRQYVEHTVDGIIPQQFGFNSWTFTWTAPSQRAGKISFYVSGNGSNSDGDTAGDFIYTTSTATLSGSAISNFDSDFQSDLAIYRPSTGYWYSYRLVDGSVKIVKWGIAEDKITPGDYDGDGITDYAVFRPSTGVWYVQKSADQSIFIAQFGLTGDIPAQGDYDGDGKTDIAIYRPSTGYWYLLQSTAGISIVKWGINEDKPAQGDYDGDGKTDIAVFRPSTGTWYLLRSAAGVFIVNFGLSTDRLAHADHDGDGKTDIAVYRPSTGVWYKFNSSTGVNIVQFGLNGDIPSPADFDADGKADTAIFRPSSGDWYFLRSSNSSFGILHFGQNSDVPVPSGYLGDAQ